MSNQQPKTEPDRDSYPDFSLPLPPQKTVEELAAEQGVDLNNQLERLLGSCKGLWDSDEDFDDFVAGIYRRRRRELRAPPDEDE